MANENDRDMKRDADAKLGSHPVAVGVGGVGGAAAGAAIGSMAGPIGTVVGGVVGAVAGGMAGKGIAAAIDPDVEDTYWRDNFQSRPYASGQTYGTYQPAYKHGWESYGKNAGKKFDEVEPEIKEAWETSKDSSRLSWDKAKNATRDAWHRVERAIPGDADGDGR